MADYLAGETGLVVVVPQVEPAVGRWRSQFDLSAQYGGPPHVTLLYPFLREDRIDAGVMNALSALFKAVAPFEAEFGSCARFPDVLYLEPTPDAPFRALTEAIAKRWPQAPPYGGQFAEPVPHLTVAHTADPDSFDAIEADVVTRLPIRAEVEAIHLLAFDGTRWVVRHAFPLASAGGDAQ